MLKVDGYRIWDRIHETSHSEVYGGTRQSDGLRVVLKLYRSAEKPDSGPARARREFELLQRIQSDGVVRAVEVCSVGERDVLIVERFPGYPLSRYAKGRQLEPQEFLTIALGIARSLAAVHDARVIHKDMKLSNVLIDPERLQVCLIDFGISSEFGRAERSAPPQLAEGTMHYIAPEQTGRMGLGVDFRTDLYSLGATLYELLVGRPPFRTSNALELIHAHIAAQPRAAVEVDARIPLALSRIVAKLLEKDPELRYQTARGLAADLEVCQKQLLAAEEIDDDLALGTLDASDRLRFPRKLYGREHECAALRAAFERIAGKGRELVLLAGPAGIGKSSLPGVLRERLLRAGGYLAEAKFDPDLRERPYAGFSAAFGVLLDQILTESRERLAVWRDRIRESLGAIGQVLVELAPSLAYVVDDFPAVHTLAAHEARERLALAVVRFVRAMAQVSHPLVLYFDDLQWADAGSLFLLGELLRAGEPEALLVICGYRDNEVGPEHAFEQLTRELAGTLPVQKLTLAPLGLADTTALLADALGRTTEEAEWLARRVGPKSQHNPLLLRRLMFHLWDRNLIRYQHGRGWVWDEQSLTEAEITDDAAAVMAARIDALTPQVRTLIKLASLIGTVFELEMLFALAGADRLDVLQQLMMLVEQGLIAPCREGFKFVHDRLREAAQSRLSPEERGALHHRAARLLLERTPAERLAAVSFQLADHFCAALDRLDEGERVRAIEILGVASRVALEKGAPATAAYYLGFARSVIRVDDREAHPALVREIALQSAESAYQSTQFEFALELLDGVDVRGLSQLEAVRIESKRIQVFAVSRPPEVCVRYTLDLLQRLGVRWPLHPSRLRAQLALWYVSWILRGRVDPNLLEPAGAIKPDWIVPLILLRAASAALSRVDVHLAVLASCLSMRMQARHGYMAPPGFSVAVYTTYLYLFLGDPERARRQARTALDWTERLSDPMGPRTRFTVHALLQPFLMQRRQALAGLNRVAESAREIGDLEFAHYARFLRMFFLALAGDPVAEVNEHLKLLVVDVRSSPHWHPEAERCRGVYALLAENPAPVDLERTLCAKPEAEAAIYSRTLRLLVLCVFGRHDLAFEQGERDSETLLLNTPWVHTVDHTFYRGLSAAVLAGSARGKARRLYRQTLKSCRHVLQRWARGGPDFAHMVSLHAAEHARLAGDRAKAQLLYEQAAQRGRETFPHHAALAHERRAELLASARRQTEAGAARREALALYREWGALGKVALLEREEREPRVDG